MFYHLGRSLAFTTQSDRLKWSRFFCEWRVCWLLFRSSDVCHFLRVTNIFIQPGAGQIKRVCSVLCLPEPELTLMEYTLPTVVSSSKWSGWRGMVQFSDLCSPAQSWAGTWRGRPWVSTNDRVMQAIPKRAKGDALEWQANLCKVFKIEKNLARSLGFQFLQPPESQMISFPWQSYKHPSQRSNFHLTLGLLLRYPFVYLGNIILWFNCYSVLHLPLVFCQNVVDFVVAGPNRKGGVLMSMSLPRHIRAVHMLHREA